MGTEQSNLFADVMVGLDTAVLEYQGDGMAIAVGPLPKWYGMFAEMLGIDDPTTSMSIKEGFPYLDYFLIDAEAYWAADPKEPREPLGSGIWYETCEDFHECHFEAHAMLVNGRRLLLIEKMGARFEEQRDLIQAARDAHLKHDRELNNQQRVAAVLRTARDELERRVAERTAALTASNRHLREEIIEHQHTAERLLAYQKKLQRAAFRLASAEETERRRIATALHDQIGQMLAVSKIRLGTAKMLEKDATVTEQLDDVEKFIDEVIAYTRSLTFELGSPILYELGLLAAFESLAEQVADQQDFDIALTVNATLPPFGETINVILFQAVRELVFNAGKYANAKHVEITIEADANADTEHLKITVADDGQGFDPATVSPDVTTRSGFGLFNISERMESIGGELIIDSTPGNGCRVTLKTPIRAEE